VPQVLTTTSQTTSFLMKHPSPKRLVSIVSVFLLVSFSKGMTMSPASTSSSCVSSTSTSLGGSRLRELVTEAARRDVDDSAVDLQGIVWLEHDINLITGWLVDRSRWWRSSIWRYLAAPRMPGNPFTSIWVNSNFTWLLQKTPKHHKPLRVEVSD
jgi:hypothetical protein